MSVRRNRVWIEIVLLGTAIACALALLLATLGAAAGVAAGEVGVRQDTPQETTKAQTYDGMVTCSRCGAKHSADLRQTAASCTRACVSGGAGFVLVDADETYVLDGDLNILKRFAGQRASIIGTLNGKTIRVSSVAAQS
jgi:hypothetical protein